MRIRKITVALVAATAVAAVAAGWLTRGTWHGWLPPSRAAPSEGEEGHAHAHEAQDRVRLSPQARDNLRLVVNPVYPRTYWQTIQVPGSVVERRGKSDRGVTAPIAGVVKRVLAVPGDTVRPDADLFTLVLTSEYLQSSQTELNKTAEDIRITLAEQKQLEGAYTTGAIPEARMREFRYRLARLNAARKAQRGDLSLRGLTAGQIEAVEEGRFLKEVTVRVPAQTPQAQGTEATASAAGAVTRPAPLYEVEELKVQLGEQVQAGQVLCYLADHRSLYIEGRGFKEDAALVEQSAANGWPVAAAFTEEAGGGWPSLDQVLTIRYLANAVDPASQTFPFYVPLTNQSREYSRDGKTYRIWRFRPGQRVRLGVRVRQFKDVFVLPADAVVREGPEAYVFRQNGDSFDRKPVRVLSEDSSNAVLAPDGSEINAGNHVAQNGAAALNRALKARAAGGGEEDGHDHQHHHDH